MTGVMRGSMAFMLCMPVLICQQVIFSRWLLPVRVTGTVCQNGSPRPGEPFV